MKPSGGCWNSILAEIFQKSAKFSGPGWWKMPKKRFFRQKKCQKTGKMQFYFIGNQYVTKKIQKKKKKFARVLEWIQKNLFLQSQTTTVERGWKEGVVNREMFIERMEECSKYSRRGIWDSQAMRPGQT